MSGHLLLDLLTTTLSYWWVILPATTIGIIIGSIPGFGPANTIVILLPFTLAVDIKIGMIFMVALYVATHLGGGIPAILLNIPGTDSAAATTLDGHPMAKKGRAQQALVLSFMASTVGGFLTTLIALFTLPYLARVAYYLHSVEMVVVILFGITLIAVIAAKDLLKGLTAGFLGLLIGGIGADHIYSAPRATFGFLELYDGVPLVPVLIGLFAISEALVMIEAETMLSKSGMERMLKAGWRETWEGIRMGTTRLWHVTWTSLIGLLIGAIPGAGATIAAFVAYQQSRMFSKTPEAYGTGHPEGIIAPEAANNGVSSGSLIPLLVIGIPGGSTAAVMMVVLQYHGIVLGPRLFIDNPAIPYGVFITMMVSYVVMLFTIMPLTRYLSRVTMVSTMYLAPIIICFTLVGAFAPRSYVFDMGLALAFGVLGFVARKTGFHVVSILIGVILGPLLEENLLRALRLSDGDIMTLFSSTIGNVLWAVLVLSLLAPPLLARFRNGKPG